LINAITWLLLLFHCRVVPRLLYHNGNAKILSCKLIDYEQRWDELESNLNPFSIMVMAHLKTKATRDDSEARLQWKLALIRQLYERGYQREDILELFRFIDWLLLLPEELRQRFDDQLHEYEAAMNRPYITSIEQRGIQQGIQQGQMLQARNSLFTIIEARFSVLPANLKKQIEELEDFPILQDLLKQAATLESLDAFQQVFSQQAATSDIRHN
jgi:hypothetical protein